MVEISFTYLGRQIERAECCSSAIIGLGELAHLIKLALRAAGCDANRLAILKEGTHTNVQAHEVTISGGDLRLVLALAMEAKLDEMFECGPEWLH